jgi:hypothetical protein
MWKLVTGRDMDINQSNDSRQSAAYSESEPDTTGSSIRSGSFVGQVQESTADFGAEGEVDNQNQFLESQQKIMSDMLYKMKDQLANLSAKHANAFSQLVERHRLAYKEKEAQFQKDTMELEWNQSTELKDIQSGHNEEMDEANFIYLRELEMESQVRGVETKAFQERKVLNSLLDTVVDGVISIDPLGEIKRFKYVFMFDNLVLPPRICSLCQQARPLAKM